MYDHLLLATVALFKQHGLLSAKDAEKLADELKGHHLPADYEGIQISLENLYKRLGITAKTTKV